MKAPVADLATDAGHTLCADHHAAEFAFSRSQLVLLRHCGDFLTCSPCTCSLLHNTTRAVSRFFCAPHTLQSPPMARSHYLTVTLFLKSHSLSLYRLKRMRMSPT